jgi:hypothetical protein
VHRRLVAVQRGDVGNHAPHALVRRTLQEAPVQAGLVVPLGGLRDLAAHEQELLPWLGELVRVQQAEIREPLPVVARHLRQQRALAVYDLVVGER